VWLGVTLVGHLIDVASQKVTALLIINQPDRMMLLTASAAEVEGIKAHAVRTAGCELLSVEGHKPITWCLKRSERASRPRQKLMQLKCEEGAGGADTTAIPFRFASYCKKVL
jgi:hypothetical protein